MALADRISVVTQAVKDLLLNNTAQLGVSAEDIYWPDQIQIPRTPAICVESGDLQRQHAGITGPKGRTENTFVVYLICYLCKVQDIGLTQKSVEEFSETVMDVLHKDVTMGGTVIHGIVTRIEPGYARRNSVMFRSARVTWEGFSKTTIL